MPATDFRSYIKGAYQKRRTLRPSLSMSAFARELGMSPQKLNSVLNQNAGLSSGAAHKLALRLDLDPTEQDMFVALVDSVHHRSEVVRKTAAERIRLLQQRQEFETLSPSDFSKISNWYELAACVLVEVEGFQPDIAWIAQRLQISEAQAQAAYDKLFGLGLLRIENGRWVSDSAKLNIEASLPIPEMRKYYSQLALRSQEFLASGCDDQRHFASAIVSINANDVEFVRAEIEAFRKDLVSKLVERDPTVDRVWAINLHCFPLDPIGMSK